MDNMAKKGLPFGVKIVIGYMVLMTAVFLMGGVLNDPPALLILSIAALINFVLLIGLSDRLNIARIGTMINCIIMILIVLINVFFIDPSFKPMKIIAISLYAAIFFYMNSSEVKKIFV
jgi:hypothetical protein